MGRYLTTRQPTGQWTLVVDQDLTRGCQYERCMGEENRRLKSVQFSTMLRILLGRQPYYIPCVRSP
jgi:hypothetical protein